MSSQSAIQVTVRMTAVYTVRLLHLQEIEDSEDIVGDVWPAGILKPTEVSAEQADIINLEIDAREDKDDAVMEVALQASLGVELREPAPVAPEAGVCQAWFDAASHADRILVARQAFYTCRHG